MKYLERSSRRVRRARSMAFVLSLTIILSSCWVNQTDLWSSDKLPVESPTTRTVTRGNVAYGTDALQKLDLYMPSGSVRGVILWFHSGGWCCGERTHIDPVILSTVDRGYALVSASYRLVPAVTAEQQLADADRALRFVKATRESWGAGAGKVIVAGGSAGGTLALLLAGAPGYFSAEDLGPLATVDPRVDAVISLVGPSDLRPYIAGTVESWGPGLVEGFLGCSNRGSQWPTTTTTTTTTAISIVEPAISKLDVPSASSAMPPCDPNRVLKFSPILWAIVAEMFDGDLPPAYLAYGDQDMLVPPSSQGAPLHDRWSSGGSWLETYYDNPRAGGHNLSYEVNTTAFYLWLGLFGAP